MAEEGTVRPVLVEMMTSDVATDAYEAEAMLDVYVEQLADVVLDDMARFHIGGAYDMGMVHAQDVFRIEGTRAA